MSDFLEEENKGESLHLVVWKQVSVQKALALGDYICPLYAQMWPNVINFAVSKNPPSPVLTISKVTVVISTNLLGTEGVLELQLICSDS